MGNSNRNALERSVAWEAGASGLYRFNGQAAETDVIDQLQARTGQLYSMLSMVTGSGYRAFDGLEDQAKSSYLWACESLADECSKLAAALTGVRDRDDEAAKKNSW